MKKNYQKEMGLTDTQLDNIINVYDAVDFEKFGVFLSELMFFEDSQCYDYPEMALLVFRLFYYQIIHPDFAKALFDGLFANIDFSPNSPPKSYQSDMENQLYIYLVSALLGVDDTQKSVVIAIISAMFIADKREGMIKHLTKLLKDALTALQGFEAITELNYSQQLHIFRTSKNKYLVKKIVTKQSILVGLFAYRAFQNWFTGGISSYIEMGITALFKIDARQIDQEVVRVVSESIKNFNVGEIGDEIEPSSFAQSHEDLLFKFPNASPTWSRRPSKKMP